MDINEYTRGKFYHLGRSLNRENLHFFLQFTEIAPMSFPFLPFILTLLVLLPGFIGAQERSKLLEFKGQKESVTKWGNLPTESFLSFRQWKEEADLKALAPDWEKIIRERNNREMVGRIFQCIGSCRIDRGESSFYGSHRTSIYEGDEFQTIGDSYAWVFLFDGTMVRIAPQSSINFNELNIGVKENFLSARVNAGNILWLARQNNEFSEVNVRETDVLFYPYAEYEALPVTDKKQYKENDLLELIEDSNTQINHYKNLNEKLSIANSWAGKKPTYSFIIAPNATFMGYSTSMEIVSLLGGKTYFKKRSLKTLGLQAQEGAELPETLLQLRGFDNKELKPIEEDVWFAVDDRGREVTRDENIHWLTMGEFITKRIPSIMMGREIFLERYSKFAHQEKTDPLLLAKSEGYRLWGNLKSAEGASKEDLELRLEFLKEYFRRVETSNLLTNARFRERLEKRGEKSLMSDYGTYFFITALNKYYQFSDYTDDKETGEVLNSTKKLLWKKMHGIR